MLLSTAECEDPCVALADGEYLFGPDGSPLDWDRVRCWAPIPPIPQHLQAPDAEPQSEGIYVDFDQLERDAGRMTTRDANAVVPKGGPHGL